MNLSKLRWAALASVALSVPLMGQSAMAQSQQLCIVEQNSNKVVCGRVATNREISNAGYRNGNRGHSSSRNNGSIFSNGNNGRYETASNRRDWSDIYDELDDIYKDVLGRNISRAGLRTYTRRLEQGWSLADVRKDVAKSDEAATALDKVYREILGRGVDPAGFRTYSRKLARGSSLRDVARDLQKSDEARGR